MLTFLLTCQIYADLSDIFVVICMALVGQEHVLKIIYFLTNELMTSQHKDLKSQHKDLKSQHRDLASGCRNIPPKHSFLRYAFVFDYS